MTYISWSSDFALYLEDYLMYSAGEEKSPLFIFLHDQLPFFLGEIVKNFSKFLQEIQYFLQEIPEILRFAYKAPCFL